MSSSRDKKHLFIGLMSGTSLDGIDAALVECRGDKDIKLIRSHFVSFDANIADRLRNISLGNYGGLDPILEYGSLHRELGRWFARAANELIPKDPSVRRQDIVAIGSHGVTVRHCPDNGKEAFTLQIGDANTIAVETGIDVVADFRGKDVSLGGQGAPLVPAFHKAIFSINNIGNDDKRTRCVVNLGGIANVTVMRGDETWGFDTGPGNGLMDAWIKKERDGVVLFDNDGKWGRSGKMIAAMLALMMEEPYFKRPPPKSTGKELFNLSWLQNKLASAGIIGALMSPVDVQCTLAHLTAKTLAEAVAPFAPEEIYVCGGGARNSWVLELLEFYAGAPVKKMDDLGVDVKFVEAMAFAWMAAKYVGDKAGNLPSVTGASRSAVLGALYKAH